MVLDGGSHHAKFQSIAMKNGRVINILEFVWWVWVWVVVVDSLVTSENDFRLSEAVTKSKFSKILGIFKIAQN